VEPTQQADSRRDYSSALFGNRYVVEVVMAIDELAPTVANRVTTRMIASNSGLSDSLVRPVVLRLTDSAMLAPIPRTGGPRSTLRYQVLRTDLWAALVAICTLVSLQ
jgi:hypothetical protein